MLRFTEDMRIGHLVIDADHQRLIEIINQFAEASTVHTLFEGAAPSDCATVMHQTLKSLIAYTKEHFAKEEKFSGSACISTTRCMSKSIMHWWFS